MAAPDIFSQRYDIAAQPTPGFMDYAAQFLTSYLGAKKEKGQYEQDLFKTMASGLASTKQLRPPKVGEKGMVIGGQEIPWAYNENQVDVDDQYKQMQIKKAGLELGLPGYEPTDVYLQNLAQDEADKQLNRSFQFQAKVGSNKPEDQAVVEGLRKTRAQQIYAQMKAGYNQAVAAPVSGELPPSYEGAMPSDEVFKDTDGKWKVRRAGKTYRIE